MKIKHLKELKSLHDKFGWDRGMVSINEIKELEEKRGVKFPISYKEFLYVGGYSCPPMSAIGYRFNHIEEINDDAQAYFKEYNINLERDIWVVGESSGSMYILFFFLDEGDNPPIYRFDFHYFENKRQYKYDMETYGRPIESDEIDEDYEYLMKTDNSFTDFIDFYIDAYDPDLEE